MPGSAMASFGSGAALLRWQLFASSILAGATLGATAEPPVSPLTPQQALSSFHFADQGLMIELVASEPDVASPVAIAWDADGRLFVAEMVDYPNSTNGGRIKLLEDRDGDGRYERATVFADNLSFPNGVLPWNGGILITAAPDILFLKDVDGDGRADERRVLWTGFGQGNQQLRVNGLFWGLDNWIYGANGRSDGEIRRPAEPVGKAVSLRGHDFRFHPGTGEFETTAGRSQFGVAQDDWGNRFLSWNTIPIRHDVLPERYLNRNPSLAPTEFVLDILSPPDDGRVFPLTAPPLVFNTESSSHFNALAGLTIYRGTALGESYSGNVFIGESLRNLVHRRVLVPDGVTFAARRGEAGTEFLASTDPWFHPVNFATGPDGALYVVDFYRRFVEHPGFVPENLREQIPWRAGAEHGRIWQIRAKSFSRKALAHRKPSLSSASNAELIAHLENPNAWWRDTAQRLLVERRDTTAIPLMKALARKQRSAPDLARLSSLWILDGLGGLDESTLQMALSDRQAAVREHAVRLSEPRLNSTIGLARSVPQLTDDPSERVRFQLALSLGQWESDTRLIALTKLAQRDLTNRWISSAILTSVGKKPGLFLRSLIQNDPRWLSAPSPEQASMLDRLGRRVGEQEGRPELTDCLELLTQSAAPSTASGHLSVLAGLAKGLSHSPQPLRRLLSETTTNEATTQSLSRMIELASLIALSSNEPIARRLPAVEILAQTQPAVGGQTLLKLLQPQQPAELQSAAVDALVGFGDRNLAGKLFANWETYTPSTRRYLVAAAGRSTVTVVALLESLESSAIRPSEIDPSTQAQLQKIQSPELASRVRRFFNVAAPDNRNDALKNYQASLKMAGDRQRGAATFAKLCSICHPIAGTGPRVGPDLSAVASRPREALLVDILDPSRQVTPDFISHTLTTTQNETETGLVVAETAGSITLRRSGQPDATFLRSQITGLRAEGKSLMPDGLENGLTHQDLADLLDFLQQPDSKLLPTAR